MSNFIYRGPDEATALERFWSAPLLAVDMETVSLNDHTALGIGVYWGDNEGAYFPIFPNPSEHVPMVLGKIADPNTTKIYHNGMGFDLEVLSKLAEEEGYSSPDDINIEDSSIMAQVHGLPASLQRAGQEWLGYTDMFSINDLFTEFNTKSMLGVPQNKVAEKCLNDCRTTWALYHYLNSRLTEPQRDCYSVDRRLIHELRTIGNKGLALRQQVLLDHQEQLKRDCTRILAECEAEGFNPGSSMQVGYVLASRGNILPFTSSRKQLKANEEVLEELDDPLAKLVLEYRGKSKLLSTYVEPWIGKERAYTHFRIDLATGRLASGRVNLWDTRNRNLQNIPPAMREVFRPDSGTWTWADHGQIELRVLAYISQDPTMLAEYAKAEPDLHSITAKAGGVPRSAGKTFNFAMVFGASDKIISKRTGVPLDRVRLMRAAWRDLYQGASNYMKSQQLFHNGEYVETAFGRRCRLPEIRENAEVNPKAFAAHVGKCAINYPIQGTAADIVKRGMLKVIDAGHDLRLQVHDEYLVDGMWEPDPSLAHIHPELFTPFETKTSVTWT